MSRYNILRTLGGLYKPHPSLYLIWSSKSNKIVSNFFQPMFGLSLREGEGARPIATIFFYQSKPPILFFLSFSFFSPLLWVLVFLCFIVSCVFRIPQCCLLQRTSSLLVDQKLEESEGKLVFQVTSLEHSGDSSSSASELIGRPPLLLIYLLKLEHAYRWFLSHHRSFPFLFCRTSMHRVLSLS